MANALELRDLRANISPPEGSGRPRIVLENLRLRLSEGALTRLLARTEFTATLNPEVLVLSGMVSVFQVSVEVEVSAFDGRLRLHVRSIQGMGFFPLPASLAGLALQKLADKPGARQVDARTLDINVSEALAVGHIQTAPGTGLKRAVTGQGYVELEYGIRTPA